jgi:DNA repair protein RAD50
LFGASQEIIRYVLFCHQDESNWLFTQNKDLKKIFDRIFDTEKFSKMMTKMISLKKAYKLRQIEVRAECDANREKFELMIGSMKEMQRNIKSLKENLNELEKEK